jgi:hypothetical protein
MNRNDRQRLICDGMHLGPFWLPPFEVCAGDFIKLELPNDSRVRWEHLVETFGTPRPGGPVHVSGKVIAVDWPRRRSALLEMFRRQRAIEWFCARTGLPRTEALPWLERVGLPPDEPLSGMAGNPKKLLSIQSAFALGADTIVFDTAGIDPPGVRRALDAVADQLGDSAAVCVTWFADTELFEFPFTAVYTVTRLAQTATPSQ